MTTDRKRKAGLGVDAIFGAKAPPEPPPQPKTLEPPKPEKMRTTIMLDPDVVILLNRLKEQSIRDGNRQTQGELIEEAIRTLARLKNIKA